MSFGGFAPFPLRLGGSDTEGWTAAQHARSAADLVAFVRTAPFAAIRLRTGTTTILSYIGQHDVGIAAAPTITSAAGSVTATWDTGYEDDYGRYLAVDIKYATALGLENTIIAVPEILKANQVIVRTFNSAGASQNAQYVFLVVW